MDRTGHLVDYVATTEASLDGPPPPAPSLAPIEVNLKGACYTATLALHYFRLKPQGTTLAQSSKALVIVSSLAGYVDDTHSSPYTASKFGSRGLFRAIRAQAHQQLNVRVNAIAPWAMKTPMIEAALERIADFGILPGKGTTIVEHDVLTQAVARIAVDESISGTSMPRRLIPFHQMNKLLRLTLWAGRAFAIVPEGAIDIGDDIDGGYGGPQLQELMALRKEAGDFLHA